MLVISCSLRRPKESESKKYCRIAVIGNAFNPVLDADVIEDIFNDPDSKKSNNWKNC
jgi:hypothetical protein